MKKGLLINLSIVVALVITIIAPFSNIVKADYLGTAPFVGVNWYIENYDNEYKVTLSNGTGILTIDGTNSSIVQGPVTGSNGITYYSTGVSPSGNGLNLNGTIDLTNSGTTTQYIKRVIHADIILDDDYVGYLTVRVSSDGITTFNDTLSVNGNSIPLQFVDGLTSHYTVEYNISISNVFLIKNNNHERWSFPIESFNITSFALNNNLKLTGINSYNDYYLPIFDIPKNTTLMTTWSASNYEFYFIAFLNQNITSGNYNNFFDFDGLTCTQFSSFLNFLYNGDTMRMYRFTLKNEGNNRTSNIKYVGNNNAVYIPIYFQRTQNDLISTDFALQFSLSNKLLDNLDIIANGNAQSNTSSSSADITNQQAQQVFQQEEQLVNNAENDLNNKLTSLDLQNKNNSLFGNSKFIASANWVKTQFNRLTDNNAYSYLITFSLVIGLSLVIIGKLRG